MNHRETLREFTHVGEEKDDAVSEFLALHQKRTAEEQEEEQGQPTRVSLCRSMVQTGKPNPSAFSQLPLTFLYKSGRLSV